VGFVFGWADEQGLSLVFQLGFWQWIGLTAGSVVRDSLVLTTTQSHKTLYAIQYADTNLTVAVLTEYPRKGVGRKLIAFTKEYCREKGFEEIFVQADKVDDYAIDFYRSTMPTTEEQVIHFNYSLTNDKDPKQ